MNTIFHFLLVYTDWQLVTSQDTVHRKYTSDVHLFSNIMSSPSLTENHMNAPCRDLSLRYVTKSIIHANLYLPYGRVKENELL